MTFNGSRNEVKFNDMTDFNHHSKVYFSLFELESLLLNCPLWNGAGPVRSGWCCHRGLTDVSGQHLSHWPDQLWSYLFTLLSTITLSQIHAATEREPEELVSEAVISSQGWLPGGGEEAVQAPVPPPPPTIQTCLSHHLLHFVWEMMMMMMMMMIMMMMMMMMMLPCTTSSDHTNLSKSPLAQFCLGDDRFLITHHSILNPGLGKGPTPPPILRKV